MSNSITPMTNKDGCPSNMFIISKETLESYPKNREYILKSRDFFVFSCIDMNNVLILTMY